MLPASDLSLASVRLKTTLANGGHIAEEKTDMRLAFMRIL